MQKYEPIPYFMSPTKINYKCILNQYASIKIIKPLEENTGEDHSHFALIRDFFNMTLKAWATKNIYVRTNQTYSKLNISPPQNSFLRKSKTQARRKYLQTYIYRLYNEFLQLTDKTVNLIFQMSKKTEHLLSQRRYIISNKHMKRY